MFCLTFRDTLFACALLAVANAMVRRSSAKRSAVHAGHRAVAVTRLRKSSHKTAVYATDLRLKDADRTDAANYSAAFTTALRDIMGSEFVGEIGVGTRSVPEECGRTQTLAEITASGLAVRGDAANGVAACRTREQTSLRVVFDTGSTNIWMASDLCGNPCSRKGRRRYNHTASTTYMPSAVTGYLDIHFGTASLRGPRGIDNFHVGPFTIKRQSFNLIAEELGYSFEKLPLEGIVGLAFPSMSARGEVPFFDSVIRQGLLEHNEFAFHVNVDRSGSDYSGGSILWGGVDPELYEGSINLFPVTQAHYWAVDLLELRVGDEKLEVTKSNTDAERDVLSEKLLSDSIQPHIAKLIVDTGTTYFTADGPLREKIARRLPDGDCDVTASYPHIVFTLKDVSGRLHDLDLTPQEYMSSADGGRTCELSLMELVIPKKYGPGMVVGELFIRRYFTVFDRGAGAPDDARIGFARARHDRTM